MLAEALHHSHGHRPCARSRLSTPHQRHRPFAAATVRVRPARRPLCCQAAQKTYYELLGVSEKATLREIKQAYKKQALKLHPDVNRAPDAQQRFMDAKAAFETLSDEKSRASYDRKLRGFGDWSTWGGGSSTSTSGGRPRPKQKEEEFYGFSDFFNDLEKELDNFAKRRSSDKPKSLWEELNDIGEEFVDYLEDTLGLKEGERSSADTADDIDSILNRYDTGGNNTGSNSSSTSTASAASGAGAAASSQNSSPSQATSATGAKQQASKPKSSDEEIDDMLEALKQKLRRT